MMPELLMQLLGIAVSFGLLWWGADALVDSAARIARHFGVSDYLIGMTIVAIGTSAPEMVVTLLAAVQDHAHVSVGNVVGSNIFNLFLILGLCGAIWTVPTARAQVYNDVPLLFCASSLLLIFLWWDSAQTLSKFQGAVFLALFALYAAWVLWRKDSGAEPDQRVPAGTASWKDATGLPLGIAAVVGGSYLLVVNGVALAQSAGVSEWVIGVTVVAAGTSIPELATSVAAGRRGHLGLLIGNLIGSDIVNLLGVLGLAALLNPLAVGREALNGVGTMIFALAVLFVMMRTGWRLSRTEGWILVAIALARWSFDFSQGAGGS